MLLGDSRQIMVSDFSSLPSKPSDGFSTCTNSGILQAIGVQTDRKTDGHVPSIVKKRNPKNLNFFLFGLT